MKENRLGPRQWAFVVVAGGAVFALPFTQRQPDTKPQAAAAAVDVEATLLPEVSSAATTVAAPTAQSPSASDQAPTWPTLPHSPFDALVQQKASLPDAKPTEEIVPMLPLRPWISAPNLNTQQPSTHSLASTHPESSMRPLNTSVGTRSTSSAKDIVAVSSPWRDDNDAGVVESNNQVAQSYGQGRRQLPVNAGPEDQYTYEEIAQKLNLPKQELASAIVPADQVLPVPPLNPAGPGTMAAQSLPMPSQLPSAAESIGTAAPNVPKSSVVLGRQPSARATGLPIRFGQANEPPPASTNASPTMVPLPTLPAERRGHIIMQPIVGVR